MIVVRCKLCGTEVKSPHSCGCPNILTVTGDTFTAVDLNSVVVVRTNQKIETDGFTSQDLQWQEQRRKRKVRKLNFEVR